MRPTTIAAEYASYRGEDSATLDQARECAKFTKPSSLPPEGWTPGTGERLANTDHSIGAYGISNMSGRIMTVFLPVGQPWLSIPLPPEVEQADDVDEDAKNVLAQELWLVELLVQGVLESPYRARPKTNARPLSFRTQIRQAVEQSLITGDTLIRVNDKAEVSPGAAQHSLTIFRRDRYVTRRDDAGNPYEHITEESIDPMGLSDETLAMARLRKEDMENKLPGQRAMPLFSRLMWHPRSMAWVLEQEINQHVVHTSQEGVSPLVPVAYDLQPGQHYGIGFADNNFGDIASANKLSRACKDWAALGSNFLVARDYSNTTGAKDLVQESGGQFRAKVDGGEVQDIAIWKANGLADFSMVERVLDRIEKRLAKSMLIESATMPDKDRVTRAAVERIAQEIDAASHGALIPFGDQMLTPIAGRTIFVLERDGKIGPIVSGGKSGTPLRLVLDTGLAAIARRTRSDVMLDFVQIAQLLGEEALASLDMRVVLDVLRRYKNIDEPAVIKSPQKRAEEQAQAQQQALLAAAGQQAIETAGAIAETRAAAPPPLSAA